MVIYGGGRVIQKLQNLKKVIPSRKPPHRSVIVTSPLLLQAQNTAIPLSSKLQKVWISKNGTAGQKNTAQDLEAVTLIQTASHSAAIRPSASWRSRLLKLSEPHHWKRAETQLWGPQTRPHAHPSCFLRCCPLISQIESLTRDNPGGGRRPLETRLTLSILGWRMAAPWT